MKRFQICIIASAIFVVYSLKQDLIWEPPEKAGIQLKKITHPADVVIMTPAPATQASIQKPTRAPVPPPSAKPVASSDTDAPTSPEIPATIPTTSSATNNNGPLITFPPQSLISPSSFTISQLQTYKNNEELPEKAQEFVQQHCDLNNLKAWYPDGNEIWQQRAPYFMLGGVWNSGVSTLSQALRLHPQITTNPKSGFFLPKNFYKLVVSGKNKVFAARQKMYAQGYQTKTLIANEKQVAMDVGPGYLFYADQAAYSILCTCPWSKIVVLLRNPVDRVYQQWVYGRLNLGLRLSLEDWMAQDMKLMQSVGLTTAHSKPVGEQEAWMKYKLERRMSGLLGRSLYVLQLQEWFEAFKRAGKDPTKEIYIVPSEQWEQQPHLEYEKLIKFLGLAEYHPIDLVTSNRQALASNSNTYLPPMKDETRKMLQGFFAPYNERLFDLLGDGFGGYWKNRNLWK